MRRLLLVAALAACPALAHADAARAAEPNRKQHFQARSMGTVVDLTLWSEDQAGAAAASEAVFEEFRRIDKLMSNWVDTSDVSRINAR